MPNRMDNEGYVSLVSHPNGAAHLGAWTAILQIASRSHPRGLLLRKDGTPHTPDSLALISRLPSDVFAEALPRLFSIGWLEADTAVSAQYPPTDTTVPVQYPPGTRLVSQKEQKEGKEQKGITGQWGEFKSLYPAHRLDEEPACRAFLSRDDEAAAILTGLRLAVTSEDWSRDGGKFVPLASKFIFDGRYKDAARLKQSKDAGPQYKPWKPPTAEE